MFFSSHQFSVHTEQKKKRRPGSLALQSPVSAPAPRTTFHIRTGPPRLPAMAEVLAALADGAPLARDRVLRVKVGRALDVLDRTLELYG